MEFMGDDGAVPPQMRNNLAGWTSAAALHPTYYEQLALTDWKRRIDYYKPIEEVTSISLDDFYQAYRQPTEICLQTPANLWPIAEK